MERLYKRCNILTTIKHIHKKSWGISRYDLEELYLFLKDQLSSGENDINSIAELLYQKVNL